MNRSGDFESYLRDTEGLSENTVRTYTGIVTRFLKKGEDAPETATRHIAGFESLGTRNIVASALRAWYKFKKTDFRVKVRIGNRLPNPIDRGELWLLLRASKGMWRLMFLLMAFAGLRNSEACELRNSALVPGSKALRVIGKGNKERLISKLPKGLYDMLAHHTEGKRHGWPVFPGRGQHTFINRMSVAHRLSDIAKGVGIRERVYPHRLRHFFGTWLYALTKDPFLVAREMGHSDPKTTYGYVGLVQVPAEVTSMDDLLRMVVTR